MEALSFLAFLDSWIQYILRRLITHTDTPYDFFLSLSLYLEGNNLQWPWSRPLARFFVLHNNFPQIESLANKELKKSWKKVKQKDIRLSKFFWKVDSNKCLKSFEENQLDAQLILSILRQPLHVSGVSKPIIKR